MIKMKIKFSSSWKASRQPRKQRKYRFNAPKHIAGKFMNATLSKELRKKYDVRSVRIRKGDTIRVMRGQFRKKQGKVDRVDINNTKVYVDKLEIYKKDGSKALYPVDPSNLMIIELNAEDKRRMKKYVKGETK